MRKSSSSFRGRSIDFRGRQSTSVVEPAAGSGRHPEGRDAGVEVGGDARGGAEQQQRGRPQDCHGGGGEEGGDGHFRSSQSIPSIIPQFKPQWQHFIPAMPVLRVKQFLDSPPSIWRGEAYVVKLGVGSSQCPSHIGLKWRIADAIGLLLSVMITEDFHLKLRKNTSTHLKERSKL